MSSAHPLVPALRRVAGEWVWIHPRLLASGLVHTEPHIIRWIDAHVRAGGTFFDVGANCGWLSLRAAKRAGAGGRVVAFEPSPVLAGLLAYHKRVNRAAQVEIVPKVVCDTDGATVDLFVLAGGLSSRNSITTGGEVPFLGREEKSRIPVPAITLDSYCTGTGVWPSLVKIDVEGAELMVLRGASRLLARRPTLIVGTHPHWLPEGQSVEQIFELLSAHGYRPAGSCVTRFEGFEIGDYLFV